LAVEMHAVLAHAQLAVGRLEPARAIAERALDELARLAGLREAVGRSTAPAFCRIWWALASAYLGNAAEAQAGLEALLADEKDGDSKPCAGHTDSCARCCGCGAISPARSLTAAVPPSWRKSAAVRSPVSRPPRFSAPPSSPPATSPPLRARSRPRSRSRARDAPHCGTSRASWRRSRTRSGPPAIAPEPARSSSKRASASSGGWAGDSAPATSSWRGCASLPRSPSRTAPRSRAHSSPWRPSRPNSAPLPTDGWRSSSARASPKRSLREALSCRTDRAKYGLRVHPAPELDDH